MNTLCVIPARGGSKGIPHKNIVDVCGRPLIDYTIASSLASGVFSRVVVSTDDPVIADVARGCGAEVPFLRPWALAGDTASPHLGVEYTLDRLKEEGYEPDGLVVLFPTHPFRTVSMVRFLAARMADHHIVKTVVRVHPGPMTYLSESGDGRLEPLLGGDECDPGTAAFQVPAGTFYGVNRRYWDMAKTPGVRLGESFRYYFHELGDSIECIDIDSPEDLEVAREVIGRGLYDFGV
jgi:CMP-N-acetylneuraminic acid synthetase